MSAVILNGILSGILLSFLIGPVFFVLIETSIRRGFLSAFFIDLGVLVSDILYLLIAYNFSQFVQDQLYQNEFIKYIAGGIFITMGLVSILKKSSPQKGKEVDVESVVNEQIEDNTRFKKRTAVGLFLKGIGLNVINPGVLIYWIAACTTASNELHISSSNLPYYFTATLATMFGIDILKIYFASLLKKKMTQKMMRSISVTVGIVFIAAGVFIFFKDLS